MRRRGEATTQSYNSYKTACYSFEAFYFTSSFPTHTNNTSYTTGTTSIILHNLTRPFACSARHIAFSQIHSRRRRSRRRSEQQWTVTTAPSGSVPSTSSTIAPPISTPPPPPPTSPSPLRSRARKPPPPSNSSRITTKTISKDCRIAKTGAYYATFVSNLRYLPRSPTFSFLFHCSFSLAFNSFALSGSISRWSI